MFRKAIIIGVGQIGASMGMNLVARKLAGEVIGAGRDSRNLTEAVERRAIHRFVRVGAPGHSAAVPKRDVPLLRDLGSKDLVLLAAPVRTIRELLKQMPNGPLIIDVGSTKAAIVDEASRRGLRFVGCHPIAGNEIPGARGADKDLFRGKVCVVTPSRGMSSNDLQQVKRLWSRMGAKVVMMPAPQHDRLLAVFSHLPHVLAYTLMGFADITSVPRALFEGLGSFRSATRVAASSPEMWRDIFLENRDAVLASLDDWLESIRKVRRLIARRDATGLFNFLSAAQKKRGKVS